LADHQCYNAVTSAKTRLIGTKKTSQDSLS
jgi:hypothetical protein